MAKLISKVYGDALFDYALSNNIIEKTYEEVIDINDVIDKSHDLQSFLYNPLIDRDEKKKNIRDLFVNKLWTNEVFKQLRIFDIDIIKGKETKIFDFISIVIDKGREKNLISIFDYFIERVNVYKSICTVYVVSSKELSNDNKKKLENTILETTNYDKIVAFYSVDKTLIAGLKIKINDRVIDSTIKTKLDNMRKNLRGIKV